LLVSLAACLWATGLLAPTEAVDELARPWAAGLLLVGGTVLFAPTSIPGVSVRALLATWASACATLALLLAWSVAPPASAGVFAALVGLACLVMHLLTRRLQAVLAASVPPRGVRAAVLSGYAAMVALPLWLGPLAQWLGNQSPGPTRIVALSPASHLAVALDCDFLRLQWFYAHSPLGGLRFDYPELWLVLAGYGAAAIILGLLTRQE
jgi:hypothetical protein